MTYITAFFVQAILNQASDHRDERKPTVYFQQDSLRKELVFSYRQAQEVQKANFVVIETARGLFGFEVIKRKALKE